MTRANINIRIGTLTKPAKFSKWFYHYHNGDQYVKGIRDYYGFLKLLRLKDPNKKDIIDWFKKNYGKDYKGTKQKVQIEMLDRPCIFYDEASIFTDYSYVVDFPFDKVLIYNWADLIFQGTVKEAIQWVKNYK